VVELQLGQSRWQEWELTLQVVSREVTEVTGELPSGIRSAAKEVVLSAMRVFHISR